MKVVYSKNAAEDTLEEGIKIKSKEYDFNNKKIKTNHNQTLYDSRLYDEPVINRETFLKSITRDIKSKQLDSVDLKLIEYPMLKEIFYQCGAYPNNTRKYIWRYLLSLPLNRNFYDLYTQKGTHPFYENIEEIFPLPQMKYTKRLKHICSLIAYWSPHVGNVYFLPNLVFPFIKSFPGDDLFIFEAVIALISSTCQFWFEFYPGAPLNHIKLCERILEKETPKTANHLKTFQSNPSKLSEIIWRLMKNIFSESLIKEHWLQVMDFLFTFNHKPETIMYLTCAFIIKQKNIINSCKTDERLEEVLFSINHQLVLLPIFKLALKLYDKYSPFQIYKYRPFIPFPCDEYPVLDKFPLDFLQTTASLREQVFKIDEDFKKKEDELETFEKKFNELLKKEEMMQRSYECLIHKEKEKAEVIKRELDLILYQKKRFYEEYKSKKLQKVDKLQKVIEKSLGFYEKMNQAELNRIEDEMRRKKMLEEFEIKQRLQNEELNNLEFEANRKAMQMLSLRNKEETIRKFNDELEVTAKDREFNQKLLEAKWKLEDETQIKQLENSRNLRELDLIKKMEENEQILQAYRDKILDYEQKLLLQQIENERKDRITKWEFEMTKNKHEEQDKKMKHINNLERETEVQRMFHKELDETLKAKREQSETLSKMMRDNMNKTEEEQRAILAYERELREKEFQDKVEEMRRKVETNRIDDERTFQENLIRLKEMKKMHEIKKEEMENQKQNQWGNNNHGYSQRSEEELQTFNNRRNININEDDDYKEEERNILKKKNLKNLNEEIRNMSSSNYNKNQNYSTSKK